MAPFDRKVADLRALIEEILQQSRRLDAEYANGPHVDLSEQELRLVEHLGDKGPRKMRDLAEFLLLAVNSVTSTVDNLERKGMVRRQRSEQDRRVVYVELTQTGNAAHRAAVEWKLRFMRGLLASLTEDEQEIFLVLFRKIARAGWPQVRKATPSA